MGLPPLTLRAAGALDLEGRCAICQTAFEPGEALGPCPECGSPFHVECWEENGGCAIYGCRLTPPPTEAPVAPASVWGQEERDCPSCGARIKMAARRCLHCGTDVAPAGEGAEAGAGRRGAPGRGKAILVLLAAVLPPLAPLALVAGGLWLLARRRDLGRWPPGVRVLLVAGVVAAAAVTLVTLAGLAVHLSSEVPPLED